MERRTFLVMIASGLLTAPLAAGAQQAGKTPKVGFLAYEPRTYEASFNSAPRPCGSAEFAVRG